MSIKAKILNRHSINPKLEHSSRITGASSYLPKNTFTIQEIGERIKKESKAKNLPTGLIERITGVQKVHVLESNLQASDLAVRAVLKLTEDNPAAYDAIRNEGVDLLIFASASQDMIEPATSHIVSHKLGLNTRTMDVKNACNSMLNGIEVADAFVRSGKYERVLVVSGEVPSRGVRWNIPDKETYKNSFPGFTMSDAGAAVLIEKASLPHMGRIAGVLPAEIIDSDFHSYSQHWDVGMLPTGGSFNPRDPERSYFEIDGNKLFESFLSVDRHHFLDVLTRNNLTWDDFSLVAMHQVAAPYTAFVRDFLGASEHQIIRTVGDTGNIASCTLPLQLEKAKESGLVKPGDLVALVGLAGGISVGTMIARV